MASLWRRGSALLLWAGLAAAAGCGGRAQADVGKTAAGGSTASGGSAGAAASGGSGGSAVGGGGASGGAPADAGVDVISPDPWWSTIAGNWMQLEIGNCINGEEWFGITPPDGFVHTLVDRNFCSPHSVTATPGTLAIDGHTLDVEWVTSDGTAQRRRHTVAIVAGYTDPAQPLPDPSYVVGTHAMNLTAYYRAAGDTKHRRVDDYGTKDAGGAVYHTSLAIDVEVSPLPDAPTAATPCQLSVTIAASIETATSTDGGKESFAFSCSASPAGAHGWAYVLADGFGQDPWNVSSAWHDYLQNQGIYSKYSGNVADLMAQSFRPLLYYVPGEPDSLFDDGWASWMVEMKTPPPSSVP